jgi:hypothetical protein
MAGLAIEAGLPSMEGGLGLAGKHSVAVGDMTRGYMNIFVKIAIRARTLKRIRTCFSYVFKTVLRQNPRER